MSNFLNTNSKRYRANINKEIFDAIEQEQGNTPAEKLATTIQRFNVEAGHEYNLLKFPNHQQRMANWLAGLPIGLPSYWDGVKDLTRRVHETDLITDFEFDIVCENFYYHMAYFILRLADDYDLKINTLKDVRASQNRL